MTLDDIRDLAQKATVANENFNKKRINDFDINQTGMPSRYYDASFEAYPIPIVDTFRNFCLHGTGVFVIEGSNGTGKTYEACASINERIKNGMTGGYYFSCKYTVCPMVRSSRSFSTKENEIELIKRITRMPYVIFDEVGKGDDGNIEKTFLTNVISARYDFVKPTVLISNMTMIELCEWLGQDINSRFHETATVVTLDGKDNRYGC